MNFLGRERDPRRQKEPRKKRKLERDPDRARPCGGSKHKLAAELHPLPATLRVATPIPKISLPGGWSWSFDRGRGWREQEKAIERLYGRYYLSNKSSFLPEEEERLFLLAKEKAGEESEFFCPISIRFVPRRRRRPKPKKQGDAAMMSLVNTVRPHI